MAIRLWRDEGMYLVGVSIFFAWKLCVYAVDGSRMGRAKREMKLYGLRQPLMAASLEVIKRKEAVASLSFLRWLESMRWRRDPLLRFPRFSEGGRSIIIGEGDGQAIRGGIVKLGESLPESKRLAPPHSSIR